MLNQLKYSSNILSLNASFIVWLCGLAVYKLGEETGKTFGIIHMAAIRTLGWVYKYLKFALSYTQANRILYTVCGQYKSNFSSVKLILVHIIHIAYKRHDYLKKGIV